jgi:RNA polymerase sigma factor (sigma-70 family)
MSAQPLSLLRATLPTDATVLARVAQGDVAALGILYDRYAVALLSFARRVDRHEAEDIVQTVFLRVLRLAASFNPTATSARPWLYAITARVAQERRRALKRRAAALLRMAVRPARNSEGSSFDARTDMERGLLGLSVAKRTVLVLAEVEGFSGEEIADMLGIPLGTVWTRLHHARNELRAFHTGDGR